MFKKGKIYFLSYISSVSGTSGSKWLIHINITFLAKLQTCWISIFVLDFMHHLHCLIFKKRLNLSGAETVTVLGWQSAEALTEMDPTGRIVRSQWTKWSGIIFLSDWTKQMTPYLPDEGTRSRYRSVDVISNTLRSNDRASLISK